MKWQLAGAIFVMGATSLLAQEEFIAPRSPDREIVEAPLPEQDTSRPSIEGIVAELFKNRNPIQMINPLAPAKYGTGKKNVSWSEKDPGKPKGFILFGIEW